MTATATRPEVANAPTASGKKEKTKTTKKKGKKKLIIALVAVLAVGGGAYKFLMPKKVGPPVAGDSVKMDPITVNLANGYLLQVAEEIQLVKGKATATDFQTGHAAELIIDEFSNGTVGTVASDKGRQKLQADLEAKVKAAYPGEVFHVFLTRYTVGTQQ